MSYFIFTGVIRSLVDPGSTMIHGDTTYDPTTLLYTNHHNNYGI